MFDLNPLPGAAILVKAIKPQTQITNSKKKVATVKYPESAISLLRRIS